ncbi:S8 family serine peptidase [Streptomyces sp. G-5]|uniref:S8 family serine peptidase n=1 Tax=Streptomyces sp. G-5 TaxID=2977231 RepID=UPI0021D04949|nr:S8 family serine peptidase [Streptomyces sp. G-5]MCU4747554.1 S8 family serine peptidase [Streptomyces sp. G-5]
MTPTRRALATTLALTTALATAPTAARAAETPQYPWYFDTLRVEEMWEHTTGEGVIVAVIDSGVDATLPELQGRVLEGIDLTAAEAGAHTDTSGHGSDMAALIAGTGTGGGMQGLAPGAFILPVRTIVDRINFSGEERFSDGIAYAVESGARIINISQSAGVSEEELTEALALAARHDVLIFAGTGNTGESDNRVAAPASFSGVIAVGAVNRDSEHVPYSSYGPQVTLAAPGNDIPGHCDNLSGPVCVREEGGTSSATALASASAALIWSQNPDWTKNQVLRVMLNTAERPDDQRRDDFTGYGIVRPDRVIVDGEGDPGDPDSPPIFRDWEAALVSPATPEPTPETTPDDSAEPAPGPEAEAAATSDDGSHLPWIVGGTAAVLLVGLTGWLLLRRRA